MTQFTVQPAGAGNAMTFNAKSSGVEIAFKPGMRSVGIMHGNTYALTEALATEAAIDQAIDNLVSDLNMLRATAKQKLKTL
jgi:hypothetical protein